METAKIKDVWNKLKEGDTFWYRADISSIDTGRRYARFGDNGSALNGYVIENSVDSYADNEVMVEAEVIQRRVDEIVIDGKSFSKSTIKAALKAYVS